MKNLFIITTLCMALFVQTNLFAQVVPEEEEKEEEEKTEEVSPTPPPKVVLDEVERYVTLIHAGAYIAKYEISYQNNGKKELIQTDNKSAGWTQTFRFPRTATDIHLIGWAMTGLMWALWGEFYNKILQPEDLNKCYRNTGTSLNRNWKSEVCK